MNDNNSLNKSVIFKDSVNLCKKTIVFSLIPNSTKVIVLDKDLPVLHALEGLLDHQVNCAPVYDANKLRHIGMLTISDFLHILNHFYKNNNINKITTGTIRDWQLIKINENTSLRRLVSCAPENTLYTMIATLMQHKVHRIAITDTLSDTILSIVTTHRILYYILQYKLDIFNHKLNELNFLIKDFPSKECFISKNVSLYQAHTLLLKYDVYLLPIIQENHDNFILDNVYTRSDIRFIALDNMYEKLNQLDVNNTINNYQNQRPKNGYYITTNESLRIICQKFIITKWHTLVVVNHQKMIIGRIKLKDVLSYMIKKRV